MKSKVLIGEGDDAFRTWVRKTLEAAEFEGGFGEWLGVPMFFSCYDPETMKALVVEAGFELLETAIETQLENETAIPFLWILARKARQDA